LREVGETAEDGGAFGGRAGGGHDRLLEVPGELAAMVRTAALRAVTVGHAAVDAERGVHGADRLAGFGGVDAERFALDDFCGSAV